MSKLDTHVFGTPEAEMAEADIMEQLRDFHAAPDAEMTDDDFARYSKQGLMVNLAGQDFVYRMVSGLDYAKVTTGSLSDKEVLWINKLHDFQIRKGRLSDKQARSALNILRRKMFGHAAPASKGSSSKTYECYNCDEEFSSWDDLKDHKIAEHPRSKVAKTAAVPASAPSTPAPTAAASTATTPVKVEKEAVEELPPEGTSVLEDNTSTLRLDISVIPDGRYAIPRISEGGPSKTVTPYIYIMVRTVTREITRRKQYRWSKFVKGNEKVPAGTIEVKEWSSDSKRLCGEQQPDDSLYRGEFEKELNIIMEQPEPFALIFGRENGYCCRCGKPLHDEISKSDGFGPECVKYIDNGWFSEVQDRQQMVKDAQERADNRAADKEAADKRRSETAPEIAKLGEEV